MVVHYHDACGLFHSRLFRPVLSQQQDFPLPSTVSFILLIEK